ncbi:PH domain-containing protein [Beauveria brongniartii RCEF 3172]|uniref:PH domain-containing protein n=1 Tax=Beauveria brongniartii RCEF 3172 TaxID=1081107 RepID=A0A167GG57_9HYPO|nr:PH domain-containing protein [Beauveria brongniartii RCEF 3172]
MTSMVAKMVGKKILGETLQNKFGTEDPYFEQVPATRLNGKPSTTKFKKVRKALPPGLSEHDGKVLTKVKRRAYRLDCALFTFLGIKFGWGSAIGLIPFAGDVADCLLALMVMRTADHIEGGLPFFLKFQMILNIAFDFAIGLVPFVGDLVDAMFKANTRNAVLLEAYLREQGQKNLKKGNLPIPAVDPSDPNEFDRNRVEDRQDRHDRQDRDRHDRRDEPPAYRTQGATTSQEAGVTGPSRAGTAPVTAPPEARVRESRGWLGRSKKRPDDVEVGNTESSKHSRRG